MAEEHTKRVVSADDVPPRLRRKIEPQTENFNRIGRKTYVFGLLTVNVIGFIIATVMGVIFAFLSETLGMLVMGLILVLIFVINLYGCVCRFHDMNRSGWWILLMLIPYVNLV